VPDVSAADEAGREAVADLRIVAPQEDQPDTVNLAQRQRMDPLVGVLGDDLAAWLAEVVGPGLVEIDGVAEPARRVRREELGDVAAGEKCVRVAGDGEELCDRAVNRVRPLSGWTGV
jgi:hypothetical protein